MIRASVFCIAAVMLLLNLPTAESAEARKPGGSAARIVIAENSGSVPPSEVQKVQRLLRFLSERSPARFSKVDPGPIDGIFGAEVKAAIIKFQRIAGVPINPVIDRELLSQIISALAETPDASESSLAGCAENPGNPACADATTAPPAATAIEPPKPRIVTRMFVQLASLPSLARAKREWRRLKRTNSTVLSDTPVDFRQVEIKGRGTYFRVYVGPYSNMADARNVCVGLGRGGRNCIVIRRKITVAAKPTQPVDPPADQEMKATAAAKQVQPVDPPAALEKKAEAPDSPKVAETTGSPTPSPAPQQSARADIEIPSLTLQAPILVPGATPMPSMPDAATGQGTDSAPDTASSSRSDPDHPATQPAQPAQPKPSTSKATETAAAPAQDPTAKTEDTPDGAKQVDAGSTTPADTASATPANPNGDAPPKSAPASGPPAAAAATKTASAADGGNKKAAGSRTKAKEKSKATVGPLGVLFSRLPRLTWPRLLILGAIVAGGFGFYLFWRRRRHMSISKRGVPAGLPEEMSEVWTSALAESELDKPATFDDLQSDFESPQMRQSRHVRDAFLRDILENDDIETTNGANKEAALTVNRGLKDLLESDPARYKQIFFNWLFMDRIGAALDQRELSADQLDEPINREFALLRSYFRIHLLELDDRHRLRSSLPGLFHCLVFPRP